VSGTCKALQGAALMHKYFLRTVVVELASLVSTTCSTDLDGLSSYELD
jgi:hypothetical protein